MTLKSTINQLRYLRIFHRWLVIFTNALNEFVIVLVFNNKYCNLVTFELLYFARGCEISFRCISLKIISIKSIFSFFLFGKF